MSGARFKVRTPEGEIGLRLPLPGLYNVYNALGALAAARELGLDLASAAKALEGMRAVFGRVETIEVGERPVSILLIKNPAGTNEVLRTLRLEAGANGDVPDEEGLDLWLALNDRIADGRDVSWIWDADFELLSESVRRVVCSGTRAPEMAVRLKYAGWPAERIEVREGIADSLDGALAAGSGTLYALPTYTALIELRKLLADRGLAPAYWS
jgi:UDP-N-acetylmuramyl tripeptide synthase